MTTLDSLLVQIDASTELLRREMQKGTAAVDSFAKTTDRRVGGISRSFDTMQKHLRTTLSAFGVGFGVNAVKNFTVGAIQAADAVGKTAAAAGFGAERFQRLSFVFRQNGLTAQQFEVAMRTLNARFGEFLTTGAGPAAKAIEQLGLKQRIASGEISNSEQLFESLAASLGNIDSSAQRAAIAAKFFGEEVGGKMQATLGQGAAAINEAAKAASGIFRDDTVRNAERLADATERIGSSMLNAARAAGVDIVSFWARVAGVDEFEGADRSIEDRIRELEGRLRILDGPGTSLRGEDLEQRRAQYRAQIQALRDEQRYEQLIETPFLQRGPAGKGDGLELMSVTAPRAPTRLPGDFQRFDFDAAQRAIGASSLQEIEARIVKMPAELQRLSPEFNKALESLKHYSDELKRAEEAQRELVNTVGNALQSTLANALMGMETNFRDMLKRMAAELLSSALVKTLMGMFSGGTAGGFGKFFSGIFGGARAGGGPVSSGKGYLVGERGPEMFFPGQAGMIVPNAGGSLVLNQSNTIHVGGGGDGREAAANVDAALKRNNQQLKAEIRDLMRRGRF